MKKKPHIQAHMSNVEIVYTHQEVNDEICSLSLENQGTWTDYIKLKGLKQSRLDRGPKKQSKSLNAQDSHSGVK